MTEQDLVKRCLNQICKKNGFDDPSLMVQRDFELISRELEASTEILLSVSTIKRLLHGEFSRMPQIATLNAVSSYLGFKNWQEYRISVQESIPEKVQERNDVVVPARRPVFSLNWKWIGLAIVVIGIIVFFSFVKKSSKPGLNDRKAQFSARKTTAASIPNSVVFNYNIDKVNADSFFIQQSWDRNRRVRIYKNTYTLTDIYYEPGYHTAKLIANDSVIKTVDVSIPTDKWFLFAKDLNPNSIPQYLNHINPVRNGYLTLEKSDLDSSRIKTEEEHKYIYTYFPGNIEVSSDNFIFRTRVRVKEVRQNQCPVIMYEIFCQKYFMFFESMPIGCASEMDLEFGENYVSGKRADLSSLCTDIDQWTNIEVRVQNKQASIFFNNKQVYTSTYNNSSGLITGLGFISNGLCEVDFVELKGLDGKVVYQDNF
jgi:hypothetical protein